MLQENGTQLLQAYAQRSFRKEIVQIADNIYYFTRNFCPT